MNKIMISWSALLSVAILIIMISMNRNNIPATVGKQVLLFKMNPYSNHTQCDDYKNGNSAIPTPIAEVEWKELDGCYIKYWTCTDKKRFLVVSMDGKGHCISIQ